MEIITIALLIFTVLECLNVIILYFFPQTDKGNAVGIFNAYEKSKEDPEVHALVKYLVNWIAGTKLIFIGLLVVIMIYGDRHLQMISTAVLILTIATFYWRLYPMIRGMDKREELTPQGYSKTLGIMILSFILVLVAALLWTYFQSC
jgi:hypothetical protein